MSQTPIELKGSSFTLSVIHLHDSRPEVIRQALQEKVDQAPAFLKNAPVVINVATLPNGANWKDLQQAVTSAGLRIVGISGCQDERQKRAIARAGLPLLSEGKGQKVAPEPVISLRKTRRPRHESSIHQSVPANRFMRVIAI